MAAEHVSSPRRSSRIPGSRSRSLYRSPGTPIGKSIDYLDFATIKLPAPAYTHFVGSGGSDAHCGIETSLSKRAEPAPTAPGRANAQEPCCINEIDVIDGCVRVLRVNETRHLA